jgi:hypothetical protein
VHRPRQQQRPQTCYFGSIYQAPHALYCRHMIHRVDLDDAHRKQSATLAVPMRARELATIPISFQSEIFSPVLARTSSRLWARRGSRQRVIASSL